MNERPDDAAVRSAVPRSLHVVAAWSWRLVVIVVALGLVVLGLREISVVVVPVAVALVLATVLVPVDRWLRGRGLPALAAAWCTVLGFLGSLVAVGLLIGPVFVDRFDHLGTTVEQAALDIEDWLVDGPLGVEPSTVQDWRAQLEDSINTFLQSDDLLRDGAALVGEVFTGAVLTLVVVFFLVKDGERMQAFALAQIPARHRAVVSAAAAACWRTLGGYVRGAAFLGAIEATVIAVTLSLVGAELVLPMAVITFLAAFVPFVGAVVAGGLAVLVALVSGGVPDAAVVGVVALLVQQFDNELLAPWVYGRVLRVHPLVVILSVATGATIAGLGGAFGAVPLVASAISATSAARAVAAERRGTGPPHGAALDGAGAAET